VDFFISANTFLALGVGPGWLNDAQWSAYVATIEKANAIQIWMVGAICTDADYEGFHGLISSQLAFMRANFPNTLWAPTMLVGSSNRNEQVNSNGGVSNNVLNNCPRNAGDFYLTQLNQTVIDRPDWLFTAMFDEFGEGDAIVYLFNTNEEPVELDFVTNDIDGIEVPKNLYLQLVGESGQRLRRAQLQAATH